MVERLPKKINKQEKNPRHISVDFKKAGEVFPEQEVQTKKSLDKGLISLEEDWKVENPTIVSVLLQSDKVFRSTGDINGPRSKKYCFIVRDHRNNTVYLNADIFSFFPDDAEKMIKHEIAHIVVENLVEDLPTYKKSYFLEEGTAGLDGATERLVSKLKKEEIKEIPDPLLIKTIDDLKKIGGDTNKELFIDQLGYLILFSSVEFLRKRQGEKKIIEIYKKISDQITFEDAYQEVCGEILGDAITEWSESIKAQID